MNIMPTCLKLRSLRLPQCRNPDIFPNYFFFVKSGTILMQISLAQKNSNSLRRVLNLTAAFQPSGTSGKVGAKSRGCLPFLVDGRRLFESRSLDPPIRMEAPSLSAKLISRQRSISQHDPTRNLLKAEVPLIQHRLLLPKNYSKRVTLGFERVFPSSVVQSTFSLPQSL